VCGGGGGGGVGGVEATEGFWNRPDSAGTGGFAGGEGAN